MRLLQRAAHVATAVTLLWLAPSPARCTERTAPVVRAVLFTSPTCPHCSAVRQQALPPLAARYGSQLQVVVFSTTTPSGRDLFAAACDRFWIARRAVPLLVVGDTILMGSDEIPRRFPGLVATHLARGGVDWPDIPGLRDVLVANAEAEPAPSPQPLADATDPAPPAPAETSPAAPASVSAAPPVAETSVPSEGSGRLTPDGPPSSASGGSRADATLDAAPFPPEPSSPARSASDRVADTAASDAALSATSGVIDLTGEAEAPGVVARMRRDPYGNGLAVLVLAGMILTVLVSSGILRRPAPHARAANARGRDWLTPLLALAGLGVAAYLAHVEVRQVEAVCGPVGDCNTVQQSEYARLFGVLPIGVLGVLGFTAILAAWALRHWGSRRISTWAAVGILAMAGFGTLFSIYLTFLEPFVIGASCLWCLSSAVIMTTLYALALGPGRGAIVLLGRSARPDR